MSQAFFSRALVATVLAGAALCAHAQVAVVMHPGAASLSKDQLVNIYLGRSFEFKALDLPEGSATREQFYKKATDRDAAQVKAVWSRVVFSGKGQAPAVLPDAAAVKQAVAANPQSVGYINKADADGSVKVVLTLD